MYIFDTDCPIVRKAFAYKYGLIDCEVRLERVLDTSSRHITKTFRSKQNSAAKLRSEVRWIPKTSSVFPNSSEALSNLGVYHEKNGIVPPGARKDVRRLRTKSMFATRKNMNTMQLSTNNIHSHDQEQKNSAFNWQKMREQFEQRVRSNRQ